MSRTLTDRQYWDAVIKPRHRPVIRDIGTQRDPEQIIICYCQNASTRINYVDHIVEILNAQFGLFKGEDTLDPDDPESVAFGSVGSVE